MNKRQFFNVFSQFIKTCLLQTIVINNFKRLVTSLYLTSKNTALKKYIIAPLALFLTTAAVAQQPSWNSSDIQKNIERLNVTTRVLYLAAHPDDENTRLISYLSKGKNIQTAYLSLTRGDGGQNLIGDEKGAYLGVIRTQELLEARKLDGGQQFFTRAVDFGYSKNPVETFQHWNKDSVLADVVRIIRMYQPHVIITRFPPDERAGHGHHTASAMLAELAFDAASDSTKFPNTAKLFGTWKVTQLYWNTSVWWDKSINNHSHQYVKVDVGAYDPLLGCAYSEIASKARSQHKSQGFGTSIQRGSTIEYLKLTKGDSTIANPISGDVHNWSDHPNGKKITKVINQIIDEFKPKSPQTSIPELFHLRSLLESQNSSALVNQKINDVNQLILQCGGLWLDFQSSEALLSSNKKVKVEAQAMSQKNYPFVLEKLFIKGLNVLDSTVSLTNQYTYISHHITTPNTYTTPYWLRNKDYTDWFEVENRSLIGSPTTPSFCEATFIISCPTGNLKVIRPLQTKWTNRAIGELYRNTHVVNPLSIYMTKKVVFATDSTIHVRVKAHEELKNINVQLSSDTGTSFIASKVIPHLDKNQEVIMDFNVDNFPISTSNITAFANTYHTGVTEIAYPHIQTQVVNTQASAKFLSHKIAVNRTNFAYLMGSGDEIPIALKNIGCDVTILDAHNITLKQLLQYQGVVVGIRAFNKISNISSIAPILNQYVKEGGFVMVQYNTNRGLKSEELGPFPISLSRQRVTEENAKAILLKPNHEIFTTPNKLSSKDFENWVQERGLYFAGEWDPKYTPLISWHDTDEMASKGALLVTEYGKGYYVFTGISFFRQLPAGVNGAYKLFANLISYGSKNLSE